MPPLLEPYSSSTWALVVANPGDHKALLRLCQNHWRPIHWQLTTRRIDQDQDALALTESFLTWLLEAGVASCLETTHNLCQFLQVSIEHFISEDISGRPNPTSNQAEHWHVPESIGGSGISPPTWSPDADFDELFAAALLEETATKLSAQLSGSAGGTERLAFEAWFLGHERPDLEILASELGLSSADLEASLERSRQRLRSLLRAALADTLCQAEDLDAEFDRLFDRQASRT